MIDIYKILGKITTKTVINKGRLKLFGLENLPEKGSYITVSNHIGSLETILIPTIVLNHRDQIVYSLVADLIYKSCNKIKKGLSERLNLIPVPNLKQDRSHSLDNAVEKLRQGGIINIFPEGTRRRPKKTKNQLSKGKTGAVRLALQAQVPIIPLGYKGPIDNRSFMLIKHLFFSNEKVEVRIGRPINLTEHYNRKASKAELKKLSLLVMFEIAKLSGQEYNYIS
jgi:1-acyl-sn-glycerol-3-phosphate acyltransferase